jgi:hypothetical protein
MFGRRAKKSSSAQEPTDDDVARAMAQFAEIFVETSGQEGHVLGWDAGSAQKLDELCEVFLASRPEKETMRSMIMAMGAYLGELIVRNGGGRWTYDREHNVAVVELPQHGLCFPHSKVAKRLTHGEEHGLWAFYEYASTGKVPPGAQTTLLEPD